MNDLNMTCGCQACSQECNCGCLATEATESNTQVTACGCGERCNCNPCRCADDGR